ncbi:hypothetical protein K438DRAFT_1768503 [Mycena galopus ATCC 62051]|nr:hypothetical protein K438DRAFT_1768503 [Mycena galopus ATCC 62051]
MRTEYTYVQMVSGKGGRQEGGRAGGGGRREESARGATLPVLLAWLHPRCHAICRAVRVGVAAFVDDGETCTSQEAVGVGMSEEGTGIRGFPDPIRNATHANEPFPVNASTLGEYPGCCGAAFGPLFRMVRAEVSIGPPLAQVDACSGNNRMRGLRRELCGYSFKCLHVTVFFALDNNAWSNRWYP